MDRIREMLKSIQEGNLVAAEKLLYAELNERKEAVIANGTRFIAQSVK